MTLPMVMASKACTMPWAFCSPAASKSGMAAKSSGSVTPERPLEERPAGRPERELRRVGQLGLGRDDADLLQLAQDRIDERVDVEVDDPVASLEHGRVAAQEGHDLLVQRAVGVDPHRLELSRDEDVADDLLERLLDLVGDGRGDDRGRAGQDLFQPPLDIDGGDHAGGDLGADGGDDRRVVGDVGDQRGISVAVQQDLMGPDGDAAERDRDRGQDERGGRRAASGPEADVGRSGGIGSASGGIRGRRRWNCCLGRDAGWSGQGRRRRCSGGLLRRSASVRGLRPWDRAGRSSQGSRLTAAGAASMTNPNAIRPDPRPLPSDVTSCSRPRAARVATLRPWPAYDARRICPFGVVVVALGFLLNALLFAGVLAHIRDGARLAERVLSDAGWLWPTYIALIAIDVLVAMLLLRRNPFGWVLAMIVICLSLALFLGPG